MNQEYANFNEILMKRLNPDTDTGFSAPATPTVNMENDQFSQEGENSGAGELIVQVTLARGSIPLEGAKVIITDSTEAERQIQVLYTDRSGRTAAIALPAPSSTLSQSPGSAVRPYSVYNIRVELPGYYTEQLIQVPIFDQISSIQPVSLIPLAEGDVSQLQTTINETQSTGLYAYGTQREE
ncbi:MAG: hypothetical protein IJB80_03365 [Clostridia bacterium]|nr:hypothetical protein [Clostridia bacterium]